MILTNRTINNWLGDRKAFYGQADTKHSMTLVTNAYFQYNASEHEKYIKSTTIHEALHLLGYTHPLDDRKCVMQYATIDTELSEEYQIELPSRAILWQVGIGYEFGQAVFFINLLFGFIISTICIALMIVIQGIFKHYMYLNPKINQNPLMIGIGVYIIICVSKGFCQKSLTF